MGVPTSTKTIKLIACIIKTANFNDFQNSRLFVVVENEYRGCCSIVESLKKNEIFRTFHSSKLDN